VLPAVCACACVRVSGKWGGGALLFFSVSNQSRTLTHAGLNQLGS
jgi:hypothetical protein